MRSDSSIAGRARRIVTHRMSWITGRARRNQSVSSPSVSRRTWVHLAVAAFLPSLTGCAGTPEAPPQPPRIAFEETVHHFGTVEQGTTVVHDFPFINAGGLDLTVDRLRSGCHCAATLVAAGPIRPGGTGSIRASCELTNVSGKQRRSITVYANDPSRQATHLTLTGEVTAEVVSEPAELHVGHVHRGERLQRQLTVRGTTAGVALEAIEAEGTRFTLDRVDQNDDGATQRFQLVVARDAPFGPFSEAIRIRRIRGRPPLRVPVLGEIDRDVTVSPAQVEFDNPNPGGITVRYLLVRNHGSTPIRITGAEWDPALGQAEVHPLDPGMRYRIRLSLKEDLPPGVLSSAVILRTDHPDQPTIVVPIAGEVVATAPERR